jgi:hypothetical protein
MTKRSSSCVVSESSHSSNASDASDDELSNLAETFSYAKGSEDQAIVACYDEGVKQEESVLFLRMSALERDYAKGRNKEEYVIEKNDSTSLHNSPSRNLEEGHLPETEQKIDVLPSQSTDLDSTTSSHTSSRHPFYHSKKFYASIFLFIASILMITLGLVIFPGDKRPESAKSIDNEGDSFNVSSLVPTPSPFSPNIRQILLKIALQGGKEFQNMSTYQSQGLLWLEQSPLANSYSTEQIVQRYSLACLFFTSFGIANEYTDDETFEWKISQGWMSDDDECKWYGIFCVDGNIVGIDLSNNKLSGSVPMELGLLGRSLESLDLSRNSISNKGAELAWIADLKNLKEFQVYFCNFDSIGISTFIGELKKLSKSTFTIENPTYDTLI